MSCVSCFRSEPCHIDIEWRQWRHIGGHRRRGTRAARRSNRHTLYISHQGLLSCLLTSQAYWFVHRPSSSKHNNWSVVLNISKKPWVKRIANLPETQSQTRINLHVRLARVLHLALRMHRWRALSAVQVSVQLWWRCNMSVIASVTARGLFTCNECVMYGVDHTRLRCLSRWLLQTLVRLLAEGSDLIDDKCQVCHDAVTSSNHRYAAVRCCALSSDWCYISVHRCRGDRVRVYCVTFDLFRLFYWHLLLLQVFQRVVNCATQYTYVYE